MAAPSRVRKVVLILVPTEGVSERDVLMTSRMACCAAYREGLQPIAPWLFYGVFLPPDEMDTGALQRNMLWWAKRVDRYWLCFPRELNYTTELDQLVYNVLSRNETIGYVPRCYKGKSKVRLPVFSVSWDQSEDYNVQPLHRDEVLHMLKCNIVPGMLKGVL